MIRFVVIGCLLVAVQVTFAGDTKSAKDFRPQHIQFPARAITLKDALATLEKQTGNTVLDLRKVQHNDPPLTLKTKSFWETLDTLGSEHGIGFSPYHADGAIALIDTPYRKLTTHHSGAFRFAVKRTTVTRDDETQTHYAQLSLELAWEPRLQPLYLNLDRAAVTFGRETQSLERQPMKSVAGAGATEIDLRMAAPERTVQKIASLTGEVRIIAAPRMMEFKFDKLKAMSADKPRDAEDQEGVKVRLLEVKQAQAGVPWKVRLLLTYPAGALVPLESYQFWYGNNRVWLSWVDPQTLKTRLLETTEQYENAQGSALVTMTFAPSETTPLPPANVNVTLHLRTPSRVSAVMVPFAFRDLPLP